MGGGQSALDSFVLLTEAARGRSLFVDYIRPSRLMAAGGRRAPGGSQIYTLSLES